MDAHYERLNLVRRWDKERVDRLCGFLKMNYGEVASLCATPHKEFLRRICSPLRHSGALALMLTILEHKYLQHYAKDTIANPFDFLTDGK